MKNRNQLWAALGLIGIMPLAALAQETGGEPGQVTIQTVQGESSNADGQDGESVSTDGGVAVGGDGAPGGTAIGGDAVINLNAGEPGIAAAGGSDTLNVPAVLRSLDQEILAIIERYLGESAADLALDVSANSAASAETTVESTLDAAGDASAVAQAVTEATAEASAESAAAADLGSDLADLGE